MLTGRHQNSKHVSVETDCEFGEMWSMLLKRKDDVPQAGLKFMDELVGEGKGPPSFLGIDRASVNKWLFFN